MTMSKQDKIAILQKCSIAISELYPDMDIMKQISESIKLWLSWYDKLNST